MTEYVLKKISTHCFLICFFFSEEQLQDKSLALFSTDYRKSAFDMDDLKQTLGYRISRQSQKILVGNVLETDIQESYALQIF